MARICNVVGYGCQFVAMVGVSWWSMVERGMMRITGDGFFLVVELYIYNQRLK